MSVIDKDIIKKIKSHLGDKVSDVSVSEIPIDSASCLILPQSEPGAQLRKFRSIRSKLWRF